MAVLVFARARTTQRKTLGLLTVGIVMMALSDSAFAYLTAVGSYHTGSLIDLGWVAAFLVLGVAALVSTREPLAELQPAQVPARARLWLPYLPPGSRMPSSVISGSAKPDMNTTQASAAW